MADATWTPEQAMAIAKDATDKIPRRTD